MSNASSTSNMPNYSNVPNVSSLSGLSNYRFYPLGPTMKNLRTLFIEAVEVAFIACNRHADEYSLPKIIDIVQQIIPSAYVFGTSYWMFFKRNYRGPLCICRNFNFACRHEGSASKDHLDLTPIPHMGHRVIINRLDGYLGMPVNFQINFPDQVDRNWIDINLVFMIEKFSYEGFVKTSCDYSPLHVITLRYQIVPEKFRYNTINLVSHPSAYENYGTVFPYLQQEFMYQIPGRYREFVPGIYLPMNIGCAVYTLKPVDVTFEEALCPIFYKEVLNFVDVSLVFVKLKKTTETGTQTGDDTDRGNCWTRHESITGDDENSERGVSLRWNYEVELQDEARALPFENLHI